MNFRSRSPDRRGNLGHRYAGKIGDGRSASKNQDWATLIRSTELIPVNLALLHLLSPLLFILPFLDLFRLLWLSQIGLGVLSLLSNYLALLQSPFQSHLHEI
jgi:hypothetical protein